MSTVPPPQSPPHVPSSLGSSLQADYEALKNDLEQATELAADFQRQLSGKSNEVAHFKGLLERTQQDLNRLEMHVQELRKERHRLANEVMRGAALQNHLTRSNEEIERLKLELETLRMAGAKRVEELLVVHEEQKREIARLAAAIELARKNPSARASAPSPEENRMQQQISELSSLVKQLQGALDRQERAGRRKTAPEPAWDPGAINISFEP